MEKVQRDQLTEKVIGAAIEVHKHLGPGLLEAAYEECLCYELSIREMSFKRQLVLPIKYKEVNLECGFRIDLVVENRLVIELKAISKLLPVHEAQLLTYLRLTGIKTGLLLNFNVPILIDGIKRMVL